MTKLGLKNPLFVLMLSIGLIVFSAVVTPRMSVDTFPELTPPVLVIGVKASGMGPKDVEKTLTWRIEKYVSATPGVDHVESTGLSDSPEVGGGIDLRVFVSLGSLAPGDVEVQVVHGRVRGDDELRDRAVTRLAAAESYEGGRHRFEGHLALDRAGSFGYAIRIVPAHPALTSSAELGLVAVAG